MALEQEDCEIFTQHDCAHGVEGWMMLIEHASRIDYRHRDEILKRMNRENKKR
jgi:hypothetical protein